MTKKAPDARDIEVGRRVRALRTERGMSQTDLGGELGLTFQQVQKYEKGTNRIGAGRLQHIAEILDVPISVFFAAPDGHHADHNGLNGLNGLSDLADTGSALRLLRAYARIPDPHVKQALTSLAEKIAGDF
jgi:transcriptional regulator with XRE-family HTH domain